MDIYKPILSFSPDEEKFIDIYSYDLNLEERNDSIIPNVAGEEQIYLYDLNNQTETKLFFLGFQAIADEAVWIDNDKFIITVTKVDIEDKSKVQPEIYLGNCKERKLYIFTSSDSTCCANVHGYISPKLKRINIYDE
jgi:hypothetical protein